jgi:hypothetical protein
MTTQTETPQPGVTGQKWGLLWALAIIILILFFLVALCPISPNIGFTGSAAILSMIAAVAIGIERIIEGFWTIIGMTKGAFWPLNLINQQVNGMVNDLDGKLQPVYDAAKENIDALERAGTLAGDELKKARKELEDLKARTTQLKALAPDNQRVNMIAASAFQGVSFLEKKYPSVVESAEIAHQAIVGVSDFVATFKDNPGRRLISILLGMVLGLLVAGVVRLDVFKAASQTPATAESAVAPEGRVASEGRPAPASQGTTTERYRTWNLMGFEVGLFWGVAFTGLLMGLGSNPTHEVIRAIQEYKKARKSDNDPAPVIPTPAVGAPPKAKPASPQVEEGLMTDSALAATTRAASRGVSTFSLRRR